MAHSIKNKPGALRWGGLAALVLLMAFFLQGTSVQSPVPLASYSPTAIPAATPAPTPMPTPAPTQAASSGVILLSDRDAAPNALPTALPTTSPAPEEPTWTYEDERISVNVAQHSRDDYVYFVADIQLTDASQLAYAFAGERYGSATEPLSDIAQRHSPVLAINGDYYSFHNNGIIIRGGELFRSKNSTRALLIVENDGDLRVMTDRSEAQSRVANRLMDEGVLHTFEFGPVLVHNGEGISLKSSILRVGNEYLEPRTAIGQIGPLHYLVIVVDGRSEGYSEGCSLSDLRALFVEYGAQVAFNLDGGGSTTLWFDGEVINRPAAGEEREVSDIVMFMP
ncbi:MAG: phosphodiester glycosidase family protein [Oscillospiraceae bacterium]|nr:phosphodiester glycosidase family protein [Oscillospiraceae bacterium]